MNLWLTSSKLSCILFIATLTTPARFAIPSIAVAKYPALSPPSTKAEPNPLTLPNNSATAPTLPLTFSNTSCMTAVKPFDLTAAASN